MIFEKIKKRPYLILIIASILFLLLNLLINSETKTILNIHDCYFVVLRKDIFFILLGITSLVYVLLDLFKINISNKSVWFQMLGLLVLMTLFLYLNELSDQFDAKKKSFEDLIDPPDFNKYIFIVILVTVSLQLFF